MRFLCVAGANWLDGAIMGGGGSVRVTRNAALLGVKIGDRIVAPAMAEYREAEVWSRWRLHTASRLI